MPGSAPTRCSGGARTGRHRTSSAQQAEEARTGPLSAAEVTDAAERFLTAWQQGKVSEAAEATDDPEAATALLTGYTKDARVEDVTLTAGTVPATRSRSPSRARWRTGTSPSRSPTTAR
ncbi:hypothetical protein ACR6C2_19845 [Streptomyces sp. INA 01156]